MSSYLVSIGDEKKCPVVCNVISDAMLSISCLQETKLSHIDAFSACSFLPSLLSDFVTVDAVGSSGGLLMAWDPRELSLMATTRGSYTLTTRPSSMISDVTITVNNVYTPANHGLTPAFLSEFESLGPSITGPWLV